MKETYKNMKSILDKIKYAEHEWVICGDLKVLSILLKQQGGNTKYPCFLCLWWDSRAKQDHWIKREWLSREIFILGEKNCYVVRVNNLRIRCWVRVSSRCAFSIGAE